MPMGKADSSLNAAIEITPSAFNLLYLSHFHYSTRVDRINRIRCNFSLTWGLRYLCAPFVRTRTCQEIGGPSPNLGHWLDR